MTETLDSINTPTTKPRKAIVAFLLSLLIPGLGQIYNGQLKKGIVLFSILLLLPLIFGITHLTVWFYGLATIFLLEITLRIFAIVDAIKVAKRQKVYYPKKYNTWYYHLLFAVVFLIILWFFDTKTLLGTQTFRIPTTANEPTVQAGDWVVGDMRAYTDKEPEYGDIVIFKKDGQFYPSRVVGRPNDKIEIVDNIVTVNNIKSNSKFIKQAITEGLLADEFEEVLPSGLSHKIFKLKQPFDSTVRNIKNILVPTNSFYVIGDNRDNSIDSRHFGSITKDVIVGKLIYAYWGQTTKRMNIDFRKP